MQLANPSKNVQPLIAGILYRRVGSAKTTDDNAVPAGDARREVDAETGDAMEFDDILGSLERELSW